LNLKKDAAIERMKLDKLYGKQTKIIAKIMKTDAYNTKSMEDGSISALTLLLRNTGLVAFPLFK
jgi:PBP1b-binding outer membrane lipoprotein LpoB